MFCAVVPASFPPLTVALAPFLLRAFVFILLPRFSILTYDICSSQKYFEEFLLVYLYIYIWLVLSASMSEHYMHVWYLRRPEEGSPRTEVISSCEPLCGC